MIKARYLFRMDDITPTMDWGRFWALLRLFQRHRVKPLLGVVPDNQDRKLNCQKADPRFWDVLRSLVERDVVEIAQHGYQHLLERGSENPLLKQDSSRRVLWSEFAGYSFNEQLEKIQKGRALLQENGIFTDFWFAPNHSFDLTTVHALKTSGFTAVSDGVALLPYKERGLVFIPQQLWRPTWAPCGVFTICLHSNEITTGEIKAIRQFLRTPVHLTNFGTEVRTYKHQALDGAKNCIFKGLYRGARGAQKIIRGARGKLAVSPTRQQHQTDPMPSDRDLLSSILPPQPSHRDSLHPQR
jgi:predicted deacetylase